MTTTISRLYDTYGDAEKAVRALEAAGVPHSDISIVGVGGTAGLLAGLGLLAIPGLGPVVAAGWLAATAVGAAAGAATGGIVGALTEAGVSKDEAPLYAEGVRRGGTLVTARVADADRARLDSILDQSAVNLRDRSAAWQKAGWNTFDPSSKPYGADEIRKERQLYGGAMR
jgi:hypothetical protein